MGKNDEAINVKLSEAKMEIKVKLMLDPRWSYIAKIGEAIYQNWAQIGEGRISDGWICVYQNER